MRIDLAVLRAHLSAEDKCEYSLDEVRQFLLDSGFIPAANDWWVVGEAKLGAVNPEEVLQTEVVSLPTPEELRQLEDELDWRENQRRGRRGRVFLLAPLLAGAASFAMVVWLKPTNGQQRR